MHYSFGSGTGFVSGFNIKWNKKRQKKVWTGIAINHNTALMSDPDLDLHGSALVWISGSGSALKPVLLIRIHMFLGLPDPDPPVRGMDPDPALDLDPSIIMQKS